MRGPRQLPQGNVHCTVGHLTGCQLNTADGMSYIFVVQEIFIRTLCV
jgi:hypothetical protein